MNHDTSTDSQDVDIPALHATIAPPSALHCERRTLYQFAVDLLEQDRSRPLERDITDSPLARKQIGDALAGRSRLVCSQLIGISSLAAADCFAGDDLSVASRPSANALLAEALEDIGAELGRQRQTSGPPCLLTQIDGARFTSALAVLREGVTLARAISPDLIEDLVGHIALIGILDPQRAGGLTSASSRVFPGLVLLEKPGSAIEVAETLVHEGAHQKFFDLGITHDLLRMESDRCAPFHPPWAAEDHFWSIETALAACHAYACLARFEKDAGVKSGARIVGSGSLLPVASERREIIGRWLLDDRSEYLGDDARTLVAGLLGRRPSTTSCNSRGCSRAPNTDYVTSTSLAFRRCESSTRVLVGRTSHPPQLYWVSEDAAELLTLITQQSPAAIRDTFARRWKVSYPDAAAPLTALLYDLIASGLLTARETPEY